MAHPAIIAQALPQFEDALRSRPRKVLNRWPRLHPALVIGNDRFDLSLLEHDFGNPDGVGVTRPPPGQVPRVLVKPADQNPGEATHGAGTLSPKPPGTQKHLFPARSGLSLGQCNR